MLSARNQLPATIKSVKLGGVMAEVVMTVGDIELVSAITRGSAEALSLKAGDAVLSSRPCDCLIRANASSVEKKRVANASRYHLAA
jgi:molybdopterin-binding protein